MTEQKLQTKARRTVAEVIAAVGPGARQRLSSHFEAAGATYPPESVTLLAAKDTAELEVWAGADNTPELIRRYAIKGMSGVAGPKLREGDRQVPEGIYEIEGLNPNSSFHLSLKLNYPNSFDLKHAKADGRTEPGTNIFIHGKASSVGCLAMGDEVAEELFVLAHDVGVDKVRVAIAPTDPRQSMLTVGNNPAWVAVLYRMLENEFRKYGEIQ